MEDHTKTGLLLLLAGLIIGTISNIFLFLLSFTTGFNAFNFLYLAVAGVAGIGGLIMLIGAILMIMGRQDYGEKHSKNVIYALILYVVGIISAFVITFVITFIGLSSALSGETGEIINLTGISTIVSAVFAGLAYLFLLHELEDERGRIILYSAFVASLVSSSIIAIYSMGLLNEAFDSILTLGSYNQSALLASTSRLGIFSVIGSLLLIYAVYIPYNRIATGELKRTRRPNISINQKRCMQCGRLVPADSVVCAYCGNNVRNDSKTSF